AQPVGKPENLIKLVQAFQPDCWDARRPEVCPRDLTADRRRRVRVVAEVRRAQDGIPEVSRLPEAPECGLQAMDNVPGPRNRVLRLRAVIAPSDGLYPIASQPGDPMLE